MHHGVGIRRWVRYLVAKVKRVLLVDIGGVFGICEDGKWEEVDGREAFKGREAPSTLLAGYQGVELCTWFSSHDNDRTRGKLGFRGYLLQRMGNEALASSSLDCIHCSLDLCKLAV